MPPSSEARTVRRPSTRWLLVAAAAAAIIVAALLLPVAAWLEAFVRTVSDSGPAGMAAFVLVYAVVTVLALPGSVLTLGAGFAFGIGVGFGLVSAGSTLGAAAAFLIARHLGRERLARRFQGRTFTAIDQAIQREGWKIVLLLRLSPLIPFNALNYLLGLTAVPFRHAVLASWIGMMPGTLLYVYLGALGRAGVEQAGSGFDAGRTALLAAGLAATIGVAVLVGRRARQALAATTAAHDSTP